MTAETLTLKEPKYLTQEEYQATSKGTLAGVPGFPGGQDLHRPGQRRPYHSGRPELLACGLPYRRYPLHYPRFAAYQALARCLLRLERTGNLLPSSLGRNPRKGVWR